MPFRKWANSWVRISPLTRNCLRREKNLRRRNCLTENISFRKFRSRDSAHPILWQLQKYRWEVTIPKKPKCCWRGKGQNINTERVACQTACWEDGSPGCVDWKNRWIFRKQAAIFSPCTNTI